MGDVSCDALIIGAGPAGSTAAFLLASRGLRVILLDRSRFPRPKLCGGLLTWKTLRTVQEIFQVGPHLLHTRGIAHHACRNYTVSGRGRRGLQGTLDEPFHLVDRRAYDHLWLQSAVAAGAEFHPDIAVTGFDPDRNEVLTNRGEAWRGRFILGADGARSRIRRALARGGKIAGSRRGGSAAALETFIPDDAGLEAPDGPAIHYGYVPWGYTWSFPGPGHRILGIAALKEKAGRRLAACFRDFLAACNAPAPRDLRIHAHGLPYGNYLCTPGYRRTLLLGDAAGLADPFLGEGIYYAHRSGQLAAEAVFESRRHPDGALAGYRRRVRRSLHPELRYAEAGRRILFSLPPGLYHPFLAVLLKLAPKVCEETIQGRRSFRWFRKTER
jgi:geranylgeranyl reductase family protein